MGNSDGFNNAGNGWFGVINNTSGTAVSFKVGAICGQ
jgi:hypothetical protein